MSRRMRVGALSATAVLGVAMVWPPVSWAQSPTLDELLDRMSAHIHASVPRLANVVCEEEYVQRRRSPATERRLRSDFLLVHYPPGGANQWMVFRDVLEVDGTPTAEQPQRVRDLFIEPAEDAMTRAIRIAVEGLRYHMRGFPPVLVNPLSAVTILQDHNRAALRFRRGDEDRSVGPGVRTVRFEEPRNDPNRPLPLFSRIGGRGIAWIEEATGRIVKAELRLPPFNNEGARSTTTFRFDDRLQVDVPAEMQTSWRDPASPRNHVTGVATYGQCRRFDAHAETTIELPLPGSGHE